MIIKNAKSKYISAFTMGEILVVMVVLGLIMSILVRAIVRVDPDKDKILFIKSYNAVEQVIANSLSDSAKYDQNVYTKSELEAWEGDKHFNLSYAPIDEAYVSYISEGDKASACKTGCTSTLTQATAPCYYLVEHMNTLGKVDCSASAMNFKNSIGVCFWNWNAASIANEAAEYFDAIIDPSCARSTAAGVGAGYAVRIYRNGVITVPETSTLTNNSSQKKAAEWIQNPTTHK